MPENYGYNPATGSLYAQSFALYQNVPTEQRLFYYDDGEDCTNFISQCVWAAYGGWMVGFTPDVVAQNKQRIKNDIRQTKSKWYGSESHIGSNIWCRVGEFFDYVTDKNKRLGPSAQVVGEGTFGEIDPSVLYRGDVIQMEVTTYAPGRYGHGLYVTKPGAGWSEVLICCHSYDRLNASMAEFAAAPEIYPRLRILRFMPAKFNT
ncbi:MAG: hypothetical protein BGN88_09245 [Clostridiales bacterium 43-6]|nr:MAG: hypothetical protein BGN88_09245 [Clostridiales bacterium 43-6]